MAEFVHYLGKPEAVRKPKPTYRLRQSSKKRAREEADASPLRHAVMAANPMCQAKIAGICTGRSEHPHEPFPRGRGGRIDDASNILCVCGACHRYIHEHPAESTKNGWLRARP